MKNNVKYEIPHFACLPNEKIRSFGRQVRNDKFVFGYGSVFVPSTRDENAPPLKCLSVIPNEAKRNEESFNYVLNLK